MPADRAYRFFVLALIAVAELGVLDIVESAVSGWHRWSKADQRQQYPQCIMYNSSRGERNREVPQH